MSERGGGRSSRAGGGGGAAGGRLSGLSGPFAPGGTRTSHYKFTANDPKYGMLLWQSKLQENLLKEVC